MHSSCVPSSKYTAPGYLLTTPWRSCTCKLRSLRLPAQRRLATGAVSMSHRTHSAARCLLDIGLAVCRTAGLIKQTSEGPQEPSVSSPRLSVPEAGAWHPTRHVHGQLQGDLASHDTPHGWGPQTWGSSLAGWPTRTTDILGLALARRSTKLSTATLDAAQASTLLPRCTSCRMISTTAVVLPGGIKDGCLRVSTAAATQMLWNGRCPAALRHPHLCRVAHGQERCPALQAPW